MRKPIKLSKEQIKRISKALREYDRKRQVVEVTESTVTIRNKRKGLSLEDKRNRTLKRFTNAFEDEMDRRRNWSRWSSKTPDGRSLMPKSLDKMARDINRQNGFDEYSNYGYAVVYYSYTEDTPIEIIMKQMTVDDYDGDLYKGPTKKMK